jgi:heme exporter protein C
MITALANPQRFMAFTRPLTPVLWALALLLLAIGSWLSFTSPEDYQQGDTVRIMYVHVPAASTSLAAYLSLGIASFFALVFRHPLADAAARAAAAPGAALTALALVTGAFWGKPMWGAWWVWGDARLTSVVVLLLFYLGYMALRASIDDEAKASRAAAVLALVGLINLPIVKFSVDWWSTLHQPASLLRADGPSLHPTMLTPLLTMMAAYMVFFLAVWITRTRAEVWRRRAEAAALRAAGAA